MGAFSAERGSVSSDSSSDEGAVLGTMPYVAYLCGWGLGRINIRIEIRYREIWRDMEIYGDTKRYEEMKRHEEIKRQ